jgi:hypothetical protein
MKQETKELFLSEDNIYGGFYELVFQVCPNDNNDPIKLYTEYIWNLNCVFGPLNLDFIKIPINNHHDTDDTVIINNGILILDNYEIPFKTINVCEEIGSNWFDISINTPIIEKVFGKEYIIEDSVNPNIPNELKVFFQKIAKELYKIYPFQLGMSGYEVSGINSIENVLKKEIDNNKYISYYIGNNYYNKLSLNTKKYVILI